MRKLKANVYVRDPESGDVVLLKAGSTPEARFKDVLTNPRLFAADDEEVAPDAEAPDGGVTGQDPASVDRAISGAALIAAKEADVLAAVGDDSAKAQAALDAEQAKKRPRKGVVAGLKAVLTAEQS